MLQFLISIYGEYLPICIAGLWLSEQLLG